MKGGGAILRRSTLVVPVMGVPEAYTQYQERNKIAPEKTVDTLSEPIPENAETKPNPAAKYTSYDQRTL